MNIEIGLLVQIVGGLASLITVYVNLNNKITRIEAQVETNKLNIQKIDDDRKDLHRELQDIKELLNEIKIDLAVQKSKTGNNETR